MVTPHRATGILLSELKADPNIQNCYGDTPLHLACVEGHLAVARVLVSEFKAEIVQESRHQ